MTERTIDGVWRKREYIITVDDGEELGGVIYDTKIGANCQAIDLLVGEDHVISIREGELNV